MISQVNTSKKDRKEMRRTIDNLVKNESPRFQIRELVEALFDKKDPTIKRRAGLLVGTLVTVGIMGLASVKTNRNYEDNQIEQPITQLIQGDYSSLPTNLVEIIAQPGDTLSELMNTYSGCYPTRKNKYIWSLDNKGSNGQLSAGKTYGFRTTNTLDSISN